MPPSVDLRANFPPVYDQGQLGSCTGNAIAGALQFERLKQSSGPTFTPSRLFIYYNERVIEGTVDTDAGAKIRDGIKSVAKQGVCSETTVALRHRQVHDEAVAQPAYNDAAKHTAISYSRVARTLTQMKGCLAAGFPFVFGFTVYESFESAAVAKTGKVPMPKPSEAVRRRPRGAGGRLRRRASSASSCATPGAPSWGQKGYFTMPYAYLTEPNLSDDFWTIRLVVS